MDLKDVSCVAHVHSTYSDGTATMPELVAAARASGAGALLLTDHDTLGAARDGWAGEHDGVLVVIGHEISPKGGHLLAFGLDREVPHAGRSAAELGAAVRAAGGLGIAAHPFSRGGHLLVPALARRIVRPHGWPALDAVDGLELWSLTTDAAEAWRTPAEAVRWLRDPPAAIAAGPPRHHLRIWDALSAWRRMPAIGGLDGHQPGIRLRGRVRTPLSHAATFGLLRTHLLCKPSLSGDHAVLEALAAGRAWLACPCVAPAEGARLWLDTAAGAVVPLGGEAPAERGVLRLRLPRAADVTVVRDGVALRTAHADRLDLDVARPGVLRVEARIGGRLWLLSNPVHLR